MATTKNDLRFTRLKLENWKNFSIADVPLQKRIFLVGPNAAGKSNFLDAFRFLRELVSVGGGLEGAVQHRLGISALRSLAARREPEVALKATIGTDHEPSLWTYELRLGQSNQRRPLIALECVTKQGVELLKRPNSDDRSDPTRLTQTFLEQVNANQSFRQVAEFFSSIRYLHVVPQLVREPDRSAGRRNDPFGGDFLEQIARTDKRIQGPRLQRILRALQIAVPQLQDLELSRDERGTPHVRGKYEHWRPQGAWQDENQFSDGTLRLLGLLWAILDGTGPLLLEEPELSLHPGVVQFIPQMLARLQNRTGRQILISTHSSEFLNDSGIGLDEVLLLTPDREGTQVRIANEIKEVSTLLKANLSLAEAVLPLTRPKTSEQLALFEGL